MVAEDDAWDETLAGRREHERACETRVMDIAAVVSGERREAAEALAVAVAAELAQLAMADATFGVRVVRRSRGRRAPTQWK